MDLFELSDEEIGQIKAQNYLIGISSDWLFPASDVKNLANRFQENSVNAEYIDFISPDGHDAFLSDTAKMRQILENILTTDAHR